MQGIVLLLLLIVALMIVALFMIWRNRTATKHMLESSFERAFLEERAYAAEVAQKHGIDLAERVARSTGELQQVVSDRLATELRVIQDGVESRLALSRRELQEGLIRTTQALEARFQKLQDATRDGMDHVRTQMDQRLNIIGKDVQSKLDQNIREGFQHFERVHQHLKAAEAQLQSVGQLGASIGELNTLLKLPHLRGGFGEATLEKLLNDFLPSDLYQLQATVPGIGRVDALVRFPRASLPIDSKFPRERVLPLFEASSHESLNRARKELSSVLRGEANRIARYIRPEAGMMDMALMFLPSETLYLEAIRDVQLWEELSRRKVFPVSPNTLAVTLKGVAISHDYYEMARNVSHTIEEIRKAQRHFGLFCERFEDMGKDLQRAQDAFRTASTHLSRYAGSVERLGSSRFSPQTLQKAKDLQS